MYRRFIVAALLWAVVPAQAPAQFSGTPPSDSVIIRCNECGVVTSVRQIQTQRPNNGPPQPGGADKPLVGAAIYIPIGLGSQRADPYVGAVGTKEWQDVTTTVSYEFTVQMEDGNFKTIQRTGVSDLQVGDHVRITNGRIERFVR